MVRDLVVGVDALLYSGRTVAVGVNPHNASTTLPAFLLLPFISQQSLSPSSDWTKLAWDIFRSRCNDVTKPLSPSSALPLSLHPRGPLSIIVVLILVAHPPTLASRAVSTSPPVSPRPRRCIQLFTPRSLSQRRGLAPLLLFKHTLAMPRFAFLSVRVGGSRCGRDCLLYTRPTVRVTIVLSVALGT